MRGSLKYVEDCMGVVADWRGTIDGPSLAIPAQCRLRGAVLVWLPDCDLSSQRKNGGEKCHMDALRYPLVGAV